MKLEAINIGLPKTVIYENKKVTTGIFKTPVTEKIKVGKINLEGDGQADLRVHGGESKAVMVYPYEHYTFWANQLNRNDFSYGQFGENFTVTGFNEKNTNIGDQFKIGDAVFEVTQPRVPCYKLEMKMEEQNFIQPYLHSKKTGFYFRVLNEGTVKAGEAIEKIFEEPLQFSVEEAVKLLYIDSSNKKRIEEIVGITALSDGWKKSFNRLLKSKRR